MDTKPKVKSPSGVTWHGFHAENDGPKYPAWRYHRVLDPIIVTDTEHDEAVKKQGYEELAYTYMSNRTMINWFWDIEDMSPKQLVIYAKEEWDIDLPIEAGQDKLQDAIFKLARWAPNNRERLVFMAHEINMNYDAVQQEIRDMAKNGMTEVEERIIEI